MVRLAHISDTHGVLYPLNLSRVDAIVHSGDFFPTFKSAIERRRDEAALQEAWIVNNAERLERWTQGLPFLYCTGNHDYTEAEEILRSVGVDAHCLNDRILTFQDLTFYGFPWTKFFTGTWNKELQIPEMQSRVAGIPSVDVLVAHGPMLGTLDVNSYGEHCGCPTMAHRYPEGLAAYLCGHIHESHGVAIDRDSAGRSLLVSNAATTQVVIEI